PAARGVGSTCPARCQGGTITLNASGAITAAGDIVSDGNGTEASGGVIMLTSAAGDLILAGSLSSNGGPDAGGGFISLLGAQGGKIDIVQTVDLSGGEFDGGELDLTASGNVIVRQEIAGDQCERRWALRQRRHGLHHRRWHGHATREHRRDRGRLQRRGRRGRPLITTLDPTLLPCPGDRGLRRRQSGSRRAVRPRPPGGVRRRPGQRVDRQTNNVSVRMPDVLP